jgi:hypothetical protein
MPSLLIGSPGVRFTQLQGGPSRRVCVPGYNRIPALIPPFVTSPDQPLLTIDQLCSQNWVIQPRPVQQAILNSIADAPF